MRALLLLFLFFGAKCCAEEFPFYISDNGKIYQDTTNGTRFIKPEYIREAMHAKDSRPADQDIEGNWGSIAQGCRVSIRFNKLQFTNGEPIIATLIIRNVSEQEVTFYFLPEPPDTCMVVKGPDGNRVEKLGDKPPKDSRLAFMLKAHAQGSRFWLNPGIQHKFEVKLNSTFDMSKPGPYTVYALPHIMGPSAHKYSEVRSGEAIVTIISPVPPSK